uniref:Transmembrane protein n=1 Tax=Mesocestoides corti TaxID=53468 RepID=A0A5K3EFB3_MESCO
MNIGAVLLLLFCISTTRSFQSKGSLPLGIWNEIVINPGLNVFNFGISSDSSGFLSYSIHSPFTKIWASLVSGCPTYSSQYGYNLGLVDRQRIVNTTQELFVCSYHAHPIRAATRAFFYGSEFAIPGGCGKGSSDSFASSTISSHWEGDNIYPSSSDGVILNSSAHLNQWTSTIRFYSVSEFRSTVDKCNSELSTNSSFLDRIIYHIYQVPLVTSGGSSDSFVNPSTSEVLKILSHVSSPVDALFRGTLVTSVYARHLQLFEDNSHEIRFTRHLGTASVVNVIAEYKVMPVSSVASSTFVAYAPTVLYTCPPTDRTPSQDINFSSNQLGCELLPEFSLATRLCVGVILVAALFFTLSGSFCVWLRCSAALMMVFSLTCLVCFYRYAPLPTNIFYLTVAGILVPVALSILITFFVWILCTRHSNARSPIPVSLGVFYPVSETPSTYYYNYGAISGDDVTDPFYGRGSRGWKPRRHLRSSENLLSSPLLHPDPSDSTAPVSNVSANGNVAVNVSTGFGGCGRRPNQYKLRRLLRLVPAIPAVFLISCLIMGPLVSMFYNAALVQNFFVAIFLCSGF